MVTSRQLSLIARAAHAGAGSVGGTAILFEQQAGHIRQVNWCLKQKWVRKIGGRLFATKLGRTMLDYHHWNTAT